ncbi:Cyclomaltodextrinase [Aerococcus viridans]|uniref:Alpha-amlyase n=2 Tax=Aerococcus viridans TaxID=1377 RepID=A0AAU8UPZ3_9LACT|nr:alpha-amylase family glycosyl hydrolase [Aerococcus viridans]AMC01852.1 alpha-amlyase [Aerococcus viridans]EFG49990.1 alpha amylase, catalytic domain protein [Aerococcus viridans ATCC 11563 = CCUG 4311]SUU11889.1 Cyclomaltodextrinase [Aerococcus viridans]
MAKVTNLTLRHKTLYKLFVRNFTKEGTFKSIIPELQRLKDLGVDIILLQSIFPTTDLRVADNLKGNPMIVKNISEVSQQYGSLDDFQELVDSIHEMGMQVMLNLQLFHLAKDSELVKEHPEYFLHNEQGEMISRLDIYDSSYDLDYTNPKLWDYIIENLKYWAKFVDGFAANHAQLVRPEFWASARAEVEDVHPYFYWVAATMPLSILTKLQQMNMPYWTEGELYPNFDVVDQIPGSFYKNRFYHGDLSLENFVGTLNYQELMLPNTYVSMHSLEFEEFPRFAECVKPGSELENWTAFSFFQKGIASVFMGQEYGSKERFNFQSGEMINWTINQDLTPLINRMSQIKKREVCKSGYYTIMPAGEATVVLSYHYYNQHLFGVFKLKEDGQPATIELGIPNGEYKNEITKESYRVVNGRVTLGEKPVIISYEGDMQLPEYFKEDGGNV